MNDIESKETHFKIKVEPQIDRGNRLNVPKLETRFYTDNPKVEEKMPRLFIFIILIILGSLYLLYRLIISLFS